MRQVASTNDVNTELLSTTVIENETLLEKLREQERFLEGEMARIQPLGDFELQEIHKLEKESKRYIQFFYIKEGKREKIELDDALIPINSHYGIDYFMTISSKIEHFKEMVEVQFQHSFRELQEKMENVRAMIKKCQQELREDGIYVDHLKKDLLTALDNYHLNHAQKGVSNHMNDALFAIEGWIPENHLHQLFSLLEGLGIHAEEVGLEQGEDVPTYMENKNYAKVGEDLVHIYDTPAVKDKDPSSWVLWAFASFFAMIISDAGYGLIFLALSLFIRKKWNTSMAQEKGKRIVKLCTILSLFSIGWGLLSGSYFGLEISPKHPTNKVNIIHMLAVKKADYHLQNCDETYQEIIQKFPQVATTETGEKLLFEAKVEKNHSTQYIVSDDFRDSILMEIALIVGVIHISLSLLRQLPIHFAGVGWVIAILGGYLFFPKVLDATSVVHFLFPISKEKSYVIGEQLLWIGIAIALLIALIQKKWGGFIEVTKIIELFADILSYLRIYALGLAAIILASTFNEMGKEVGFIAGAFIILFGHAINIAVGIMGGIIHGLRLNFIEWYHHSFTGGGKLFNPLKLMKSEGE